MAFKVGVSGDLFDLRGEPTFGREPLSLLDSLSWEKLPQGLRAITPERSETYDALYLNLARVDASSVATPNLRLKLISRHGVGYDAIDIPAMTKAGVLVSNTPDAVRRPVATISLLLILALSHRLFTKDRLTRDGRWAERVEHMGTGLRGPIVDERALYETLSARRIAGAAPRRLRRRTHPRREPAPQARQRHRLPPRPRLDR